MKKDIFKLLLKIFIILGFISVLIIYCEIKLREIPNSYNVKRNYLEKNLDSIQVLILGSSHAFVGINPAFLYIKGFNLANNAQSLYYDKELALKFIDKMPELKIVLISISYFSLLYEVNNFSDNWRDNFYYRFWQIKSVNSKILDLKKISYVGLYGTSFVQNAFRKNFIVSAEIYPDENGWLSKNRDSSFSPNDSVGLERINLHKSMMQDGSFMKNLEYLETLLSEITKRQIIPVFITTPTHKLYYDKTDPEKIKQINETINKFCLKYHCKYFNYNKDLRFNNDDFADIDHLNPAGAEKLTMLINSEILNDIIYRSK